MTWIVSIIIVIGLFAGFLSFFWLHIELYFLTFKIENHPVLRALVDDLLSQICKEEGIRIYNKTYEQLNADIQDEKEKSLGMYVYTLDERHQQRVNDALLFIEDIELQYKKSYKDICVLVGAETKLEKEDFVLPRILICTDRLMTKFGANSYYSTFFHELGHHFVVKETHARHTENDADMRARALILERLPFFFQLFPFFTFKYRIDNLPELTYKEKFRAYLGYLKYYIENKNTIVKIKKKKD